MKVSKLTITLPETLRVFVEAKAGNGNYASVSEYLRELIKNDLQLEIGRIRYDPPNRPDPPVFASAARTRSRDIASQFEREYENRRHR